MTVVRIADMPDAVAMHAWAPTFGALTYARAVFGVGQAKLDALKAEGDDLGAFRTKSLRNVSQTPPYMHTGAFETLEDVIDFYSDGGADSGFVGEKSEKMQPLNLTDDEKADLVAFLKTLTGGARHGYAILQEADERSDGHPGFEIPTLYRALRRMRDAGLIRTAKAPPGESDEDARREAYDAELDWLPQREGTPAQVPGATRFQ